MTVQNLYLTSGVNSNTLENLKSALTNKGEWDKISIVYPCGHPVMHACGGRTLSDKVYETGKEENK